MISIRDLLLDNTLYFYFNLVFIYISTENNKFQLDFLSIFD